ncbi:Uncharacterised protein [BD1-7 clade bacterium]|uniref:Uncharacterized protein n=1 Tax=BD1-7 clade bacterium TaxID=2029982 RepID=A0A5S9PJV0_9GAMM|nr:Uncharacterised protein [BD1-7 clade bacterium]
MSLPSQPTVDPLTDIRVLFILRFSVGNSYCHSEAESDLSYKTPQ